MKTRMFKNKILTSALLGAAGAIALSAQQAFALGMMGGAIGHVGAMGSVGSVRMGSVGSHTGASGMAGSVTMNGITVLPNGSLIVPAVTPRQIGPGTLNIMDPQQTTEAPCRTPAACDGY